MSNLWIPPDPAARTTHTSAERERERRRHAHQAIAKTP
jgi:hypothetical protein